MAQINQKIAKLLIFLLYGIRPLLGPATCKYPISCTDFAVQQLQEKPLAYACIAIIKRIVSCIKFL